MTTFNDFLNEQMIKAEWEALDPECSVIEAILKARKESGLTQKQLSERTGHRADGYKQIGARKRKPVSAHAAKAGRRYGNARQNRVRAGKCKRSAVKQALVKQRIPLDIGIKWDLSACRKSLFRVVM